ncbi:hypothetical protein COCC4DRAFT_56606 [Bipolaris maydis ATCC 48331]|uniref:Uncharacterized protein n=2 Tax=Cochliobolus heterostrophus TaxID=5016 RepID=M2SZ96_COCH5|nr:uncharacterized protein COCC4DRAFT_56606 [Bipolaris maydis ATCC 48331]EMD90705.1 hypothetical protein COCHEDRAFT_1031980 [Bipolaris maydis C5]ENI09084.1 hypothetical protein COCC4DRAFT_56606 [Bipolaris maydis ATCC 48331]KAJ6206591.1 hypothetical protein PSV09DRAFT_1031980 [Bipolaris maydis]KAJ6280103.1 hypothetical protein J3E71DRAFT_180547 [Bipolaris maydis]
MQTADFETLGSDAQSRRSDRSCVRVGMLLMLAGIAHGPASLECARGFIHGPRPVAMMLVTRPILARTHRAGQQRLTEYRTHAHDGDDHHSSSMAHGPHRNARTAGPDGVEAAVANGGHAKSRRYWPAPKATTAAPQPPSNPPSKYTCPAIHHCPLPTAHCPLPTPHSTSLASSACVSPPARVSPAHVARAPCTASADVPTRLPLRVHVPGSHSVRFCSCVANKPSLPHTGGPFLEPRGAQAGLKLSLRLNSPGPCTAPSSRHRLRCPADCRRTCQAPSHQNMLVLLCRRSILTLSSWLRRGWRPAGACAAFTRDNTCPTALVTRPSPVSPAGHRASSVR